jgi:hypothetical protein
LEGYVEKHHIIPKCMGGLDELSNLVALTPEEHFVAHQLLVKMFPDNHKLMYAARMMCSKTKKHNRQNKLYGWLRKQVKETSPRKERKTETKPRKKRVLSEEHKKKIGLSGKGKKHNHTPETLQKIKDTNRITKTGKKHELVQCPYCFKTGGKNIMHLSHFSNCKFNR